MGVAGDVGFAEHFDDMLAADLLQEEKDVDQGGAEEHLKALKLPEAVSALLELMCPSMALQHQHLECFPRFVSTQKQMAQELWGAQVLESYQA